MPQRRKWKNNAERQAAHRRRQKVAFNNQRTDNGMPVMPKIPPVPGWPRWMKIMGYVEAILTTLDDEMDSYHDDRTDRWRDGEKGYEHLQKLYALRAITDEVVPWPD